MFHGSTSPGVTDKQTAMGVLTEGTNLATVPGADKQTAMGVLAEGTNLATVPGVTDKQTAMGVLTEGANPGGGAVIDGVESSANPMVRMHMPVHVYVIGLGVGREGQATAATTAKAILIILSPLTFVQHRRALRLFSGGKTVARYNERGERTVWLDEVWVDRLGAMRGPGEDYSDVILRIAGREGAPREEHGWDLEILADSLGRADWCRRCRVGGPMPASASIGRRTAGRAPRAHRQGVVTRSSAPIGRGRRQGLSLSMGGGSGRDQRLHRQQHLGLPIGEAD